MVADLSYEEINLNSFRFQSGDLISALELVNLNSLKFSGYFRVTFDSEKELNPTNPKVWNLYFSEGKIVFSSSEEIRTTNILKILENYLPSVRDNDSLINSEISKIMSSSQGEGDFSILRLLKEFSSKTSLVDYQEITKAVQVHILNELDRYLFSESGTVKIVADRSIDNRRPVIGFDLEKMMVLAKQRKAQWHKLNSVIPSMSCRFTCNKKNPQWHQLSPSKRQKIKQLVNSGKNIEEIRYNLGEDSLKVVKTFAKLIENNLIIKNTLVQESGLSLVEKATFTRETKPVYLPKVAVIDDSPILLKQFKKIVTDWGYDVCCCNDASVAVNFLLDFVPDIIFLDVNMPEISGFQLMKKIRMQSTLNSIPLVVLTAEKTLMNRQRAKWSKSIFLTKPLSTDEISIFKSDLNSLLNKLLKSHSS